MASNQNKLDVAIHPLESQEGVLVKVTPPKEPAHLYTTHVPCDIVLVLDVSGSMDELAPIINPGERDENPGCTVLDIVKHAALTILHTLDETDRLGLVVFSSEARGLQQLVPMDEENKKEADKIIRGLRTGGGTDLWQGLEKGLGLFSPDPNPGKTPALMLLTDGLPNQGAPAQGYAEALRARGSLPATIQTFGFGPQIMSGLLSTMAEIGGGCFGFIPHSNMVPLKIRKCTVIVNAVAHLQSTFAADRRLHLTARPSTASLSTEQRMETHPDQGWQEGSTHLTVRLGNIQYGQTRDIYVRFAGEVGSDSTIYAQLVYSNVDGAHQFLRRKVPVTQASTITNKEMAFHENRSWICRSILELFARDERGFPTDSHASFDRVAWFARLVEDLTVKDHNDKCNRALDEQVEGLIRQAAHADGSEWKRWGKHYLLGVWAAHAKQLQTTFLDPGVQAYDAESPLFTKCRDRLAKAFEEEVVPPTPSRPADADPAYSSGSATLSMESYNSRSLMRSHNAYSSPGVSRDRKRGEVLDLDLDLDDFYF
ncbi:hypothetical protein PG985_000075 [Apiospora marii]|uniref:uncharacterized protein n=1 Tax=Apiospora marii TaxID=335849 RepID=UPI003130DEF1